MLDSEILSHTSYVLAEGAAGKVLVSDADAARLARILAVLGSLGAVVRVVRGGAVDGVPGGCDLALIALDNPDPEGGVPCLQHWRARGYAPVAYAHGSEEWPIARRCAALLAGASALLDSNSAAFETELHGIVTHLLERERKKAETRDRARAVMLRLGLVGESALMGSVFQTILRISGFSRLPVLLTGETGTGKELAARALHQLDERRSRGPMVAVNCGAIAAGVVESELFGHRRGAFTGAEQNRKGLFRAADGGVLFLDEVQELDAGMQTKLLRVLQEGRLTPVGEEREVALDVRVIAAANCDLEELVRAGRFRADLYHRLNVFRILMPPLRERPEDVAPLVEHFLQKHGALGGSVPPGATPGFISALRQHRLPGNVRQLENLICWALANRETAGPLGLGDLPAEMLKDLAVAPGLAEGAPAPRMAMGQETERSYFDRLLDRSECNLARAIHYCERQLLAAALERADGNQTKAARMIGVTPRSIYNKLHKRRAAC